MDSANVALPDLDGLSVAELKTLLQEQHAHIAAKEEQIVARDAQIVVRDAQLLSHTLLIERLKLEILRLRRLQYGRRSEKREQQIEQLGLWVEELESADAQGANALAEHAQSTPMAEARKPRRVFPAHLPRETNTIMPREECCPDCGGALKHLGEDVSETLDLEPVRFKVIRQVRPKMACASCDTIVQAPAAARPIERGMAGPGLLAPAVAAFLDRLMHHSHLAEIRGKSYRLHEHSLAARNRKAKTPA